MIMIVLMLFVQKTKPGQAMLAVSEDKDAAQLMGVNVNATISLTFAIGSGLAAIAGVLFCSAYPTLTPYTGAMPGIKAFRAAVFRRNRIDPGSVDRRNSPWSDRDFREGIHFLPDGGCDRICGTDRCASCETYRTS